MLEETFKTVKEASRKLALIRERQVSEILTSLADKAEQNVKSILEENKKDLDRMPQADPKYDRLKLTEQRIKDIATDLRNVAQLPSPLGVSLEKRDLKNGLSIEKVTVPLGVIGIIYESRPNVTFDVFSLCLKSGNVCLLKGGSDAEYSNKKIVALIKEVLTEHHVDPQVIELLPSDRSATHALLNAVGYVDVIIPRGSQSLIDYVRDNSKVSVIETGAGIVHTYFDSSGDVQKGADIVFNSKTRRVSVCNALDCLIIHKDRLEDLPALTKKLATKNVILYADEKAINVLRENYPQDLLSVAEEKHFGTEFLDYKMSIKTVESIEQALDHIFTHGSKHSEAIVAEDESIIDLFLKKCRCCRRVCKCVYSFYRWRAIWSGRRNRYKYAKVTRTRSHGVT